MDQHLMTTQRRLTAAVMLLVATTGLALAQYPEDALRLGLSGPGVGARALSMGGAYTGVASDYSAIYWNPAGLAQMQYSEFSAGLSYLSTKDNSTFFGSAESYSNSATTLNSLGLVQKVPTVRGSLVLGFGFHRSANFLSGLSFTGFNPNSSIIQTYARDGAKYPSDLSDNIAYQTYLADFDTATGNFISPIANRVTQLAKVLESGGLNNWSIAAGVDIAPNVSLGLTLTYVAGSYHYERSYEEQDRAHVYEYDPARVTQYDMDYFTLDEYIDGDISGFNAKFGLLYRVPDRFRFGVTVKTPTSFSIEESYGTSARAYFDNGDIMPESKPFSTSDATKYGVRTPWVFGAGASVMLGALTLSGDVEYTDWTQMEFKDANSGVIAQNKDFKTLFRATADLRAGLEYEFPGGFRIRGGYAWNPSPYKDDPSAFDQKYLTGGLGIPLGGSTMLDLTYARGGWDTFRTNYNSTSRVDESITTHTILATFSHRF
jgi:long-subunit fatty acid transport protein